MNVVAHHEFNCKYPEEFDWKMVDDEVVRSIAFDIVKLIEKYGSTDRYMADGMRAALVCIAVRTKIDDPKNYKKEFVSARGQNLTKKLKALKTADFLN
jgi:hypothetical protein